MKGRRPGVPSGHIRSRREGIAKLRAAIGKVYFEGISVRGHCIGIQARAWRDPSQAANYNYALDAARAVQSVGKMRSAGKPPRGALVWWSTGSARYPGHVATVVGARRKHVIGNVGSTIQVVPLTYFSAFDYLGWCYPGDVIGWVPGGNPK